MWETTFDAIRDPVMIINQSFRIIRANREAAAKCNQPTHQLIGKKCYEIFAKRKSICRGCPLEKTLESGQSQSSEIESLAPRNFQVNSYPLSGLGEEDRPLVVHHYRDVSEERNLQRKLIQSEKMAAVGMLAGGVAHEINNPLAGILAFTQLLKKELTRDDPSAPKAWQDDLQEIEGAANRCKQIVEDLLNFARPHGESEMNSFSLSEEAEKILPMARLHLRHQNVVLVTEYEPDLSPVRGNAKRLQQVFLNLISNAAHSMPQGGEVKFKIRNSPDRAFLWAEITDHGCGIPREDLKRIFDPFFSTKLPNGGTGLGLSIGYSIIQDHGGRIEVESTEGQGSLFRVILPAHSEKKRK